MFAFPTGTAHLGMLDYVAALSTQADQEPLTPAEHDALLLVSYGMSLAAIAEACDVQVSTVKARLETARPKLVARSSAQGVYHGFLCGVFDQPFEPCPPLVEVDSFIIRLVARGGVEADPWAVSSWYKRPSSCRSALARLQRQVGAHNQAQLVRLAWGWGPSPLDCLLPAWYAPDA